ncbi:hypothetical protein GGR32_000417 [Mesonia hippocampi]|uniref:DNA topoisomerase IV n=1 Tax=Mesonia hippocampi TaxID=1628250 RepID=A0A840EM03_9FLAO|nr:DNA topoisomerase IV [Mesonia hippocampi]MBB4118145.1 hypothetical protein [Mesonia hippocampi]
MKKIAFLCLSLAMLSCYAPDRNCADFKTGTFKFETYLDGELVETTFVRNDTIEIDYYRNKADTSSVRWINDCEFILKNLNPKNMAEEKALHMKILSTTEDSYTFEYSVVGETTKQQGTVKKVN